MAQCEIFYSSFFLYSGQYECNKKRAEAKQKQSAQLKKKESDPNAGLPKDAKDFKPVIPNWPTPSGKTEASVRAHCEGAIKATETYKSCNRVLGARFNIKGAVDQCIADTLVRF